MADVQLEHGFTRLADDLLEALCRLELPARHFRTVLAVVRLTYGYNRTEAPLGAGVVASVMGLGEKQWPKVRGLLRDLERWHIITRTAVSNGQTPVVALVKDFEAWAPPPGREADRAPVGSGSVEGRVRLGPGPTQAGGRVPVGAGGRVPVGAPSKENSKENFKEKEEKGADARQNPSREKSPGGRKPSREDRLRAIWPRLVETAAEAAGVKWSSKPSKKAHQLLIARMADGSTDEDLANAIIGAVAQNGLEVDDSSPRAFNPRKYYRPETVYQLSKIGGYLFAFDNRETTSPKAKRIATMDDLLATTSQGDDDGEGA